MGRAMIDRDKLPANVVATYICRCGAEAAVMWDGCRAQHEVECHSCGGWMIIHPPNVFEPITNKWQWEKRTTEMIENRIKGKGEK